MPARDGTGAASRGHGCGRNAPLPIPPPERRLPPPAEGDAKAFWTGLATVVAQYLLSCWLGGNARGSGRHGHSRRF
ncbi:MAG: hypothetical protein GX774_08750 [Armatimonadetes bacterium]|jgi:hypothetical protein|nr:hypothetical protein [Armatimonadota bacterium]